MEQLKKALNESIADERQKNNNDPISLGLLAGVYGAVTASIYGGMGLMIQTAYTNDGLGAAVLSSVAIAPVAGIVGVSIGAYAAPVCIALGQVIKEKMQENKLDFSLGISEKIGDDVLASKICKILREFSDDKEKFNKFTELVDLNKDDVQKIEQLIEAGNKEIQKRDISKGKKDYSQEFAILS